jgi:dihydroxy-acid dehydratase
VGFRLDDWDRLGRGIPVIADLMPSGRFLMEDFSYAGGLPALLHTLGGIIDGGAPTVTGRTLGEEVAGARVHNAEVIRPLDRPVAPEGGLAVLRGNLCPDGAVLKPGAATPRLMQHRGRAVVFSSIEDFHARIDDEALPADADSVLVLQNCGPKGYPGMPEAGNLQLPRKLLRQGVTDMVRLSDCRMSGTAYGTVVLHIAPEAAVGGPLALVRDGDWVSLDVPARRLTLEVPEGELARRRAAWQPPGGEWPRGYFRLYTDHVLQADRGADFDFLVGASGDPVRRDMH